MPRKKPNYGQKPLPNLEGQLEDEAIKNEQPPTGMPSLAVVRSYMIGIGLTDGDAEQIYDSWLMSGFTMKNGQKIKSWRAAIRTWMRHELFLSQKKAKVSMNAMEQRERERAAAIRRLKDGH